MLPAALADSLTETTKGLSIPTSISFSVLKAALATTEDQILIFNHQLELLFANPAFERVVNIPLEELIGKKLSGLNLADEFFFTLSPVIRVVLSTGHSKRGELTMRTETGLHFFEYSVSAIKQGNQADQVVAVIRDVTNKRKYIQKISEERQLMQDVLNSLFVFVGVLTPEGILIEANRAALDAAQLSVTDVLHKPFEEAYWWSFSETSKRRLREAIETVRQAKKVRFDTKVRLSPSDYIDIDFSMVPILDADNQVKYIIPSAVDISDRQRVQQELEETVSVLQGVLENAPIGIGYVNKKLRFKMINPALAEMNGTAAESLLNQPVVTLPTLGSPKLTNCFKQVLETRKAIINQEIKGKREDARKSQYWRSSFYPLLTQRNELLGVGITVDDITDEKRNQQNLLLSEKRFRQIAELMPQIVWTAKPTGYRDYYNQRWSMYTGLDTKEALGSGWTQVIHPEDRRESEKAWKVAVTTTQPFERTHRLRRYTGKYRWFLVRAIPVIDEDGKVIKWYGTATDIHEAKIITQRKDEFISIASHELKTPLTSIKAYNQLLQKYLTQRKSKIAIEYVNRADNYIEKLHDLITDLLDVSKLQSGTFEIKKSWFDFDSLMKMLVKDMKAVVKSHDIEIQGSAKLNFFGDKKRLEQVFNNLMTNAIKYSPKANKILVKIEKNAELKVSVTDHGIGIPKFKQEKIFEKFYRVESSSHRFSGMGIGLFISSEIIKRHGGSISVHSELEKGSTFTVHLPLLKEHHD